MKTGFSHITEHQILNVLWKVANLIESYLDGKTICIQLYAYSLFCVSN